MKKLISLLIVFILFTFSCKEEVPTEPEKRLTETLAEATIGPSGGEIKTDEFSLIVPEGAFAKTENIKLFLPEAEFPLSENKISNAFKIEGIPRDFNKALILKIKYNKEPEGECYISLGSNEYIEEREEYIIMYDLLDVEISSGYLTSTIKPMTKETQHIKKVDYIPPKKYLELFGYGLFKMLTYKNKTVEIKYRSILNESKIIKFGNSFDKAADFFSKELFLVPEIFFSSTETDRIRVTIVNDGKNTKNYDCFSEFRRVQDLDSEDLVNRFKNLISNFKINLNETMFNSSTDDDFDILAGMSVYRLLKTLYLGSEYNWFDWAMLSWVKNTFSLNADKLESVLLIHAFKGLEAGINYLPSGKYSIFDREFSLKTVGHGIGMSPLCKFLMNKYNDDGKLLLSIYAYIIKANEQVPTTFLIKAINDPENIWWPQFIKEYLLGKIYKNTANDFLDKIPSLDELHFIDETDTLKYFERTYPDLSAKICRINLSQQIKEKETLDFKIDPSNVNLDYVKVMVFGVLDEKFVLLNEGTEFSVSDLQQYSTLVACVVNSGNEPPYTGTSNINLDIKIIGNELPPIVDVQILSHLSVDIHVKIDSVEYDNHYEGFEWVFTCEDVKLINKNTYYGEWNENRGDKGDHYTGEMTLEIDPTTKNLKYFEATQTINYYYGETGRQKIVSKSIDFEGEENPLMWRPLYYDMSAAACDYIYIFEYYKGNDELYEVVTGYSCNYNAANPPILWVVLNQFE